MSLLMQSVSDATIIGKFYERTGRKLPVFISYNYLRRNAVMLTSTYRPMIDSLALDSGAYSAWRGTSSHSREEFSKYINRYGPMFDPIFNFDNDFENPEHNLMNLRYLQERFPYPSRIIPVVHDLQDPVDEVRMYREELGHDYIAIGSNRPLKDAEFKEIKNRWPDLKLHIFGSFRRDMLFKQRPYSADSSTFIQHAANDLIYYYDPLDRQEYTIRIGSRVGSSSSGVLFTKFNHRQQLEAFLGTDLGLRYQDLFRADNRMVVNLHFFSQLQDRINEC